MPRFYFYFPDADGRESASESAILPDEEAAWFQAVRSARVRLGEQGLVAPGLGQRVEIVDEQGIPVNAVSLAEVAGVAF